MAPAEAAISPRPGPQGRSPMAETRILDKALPDEVRRTVLREAEHRYRHELLDDEERQLLLVDEERQLLLDRIQRLRQGKVSRRETLGPAHPHGCA